MNKPYIKKIHIFLEIITYILFLATTIMAIIFVVNTDGEIPTHFSFSGEIDGYGSPAVALILPLSLLFTALIISLIMHFLPPSMMNLPVKPKPGREIQIYSDMISMVAGMNLSMALFTLVETIGFINANNTIIMISIYILLISIFALVPIFIIKSIKDNR